MFTEKKLPFCLPYLIITLFITFPSLAQWESDYKPKEVYTEYSFQLIRTLTIQGAQQILLLGKDEKELIDYFASNTQDLIGLVQNRKFINDDTLKNYLHSIVINITKSNDIITPRKVLVLKSTKANAYSLGDGTLVICNGLLTKLNSEEELAFILAHEMAHWQLSHFKKKVINNLASKEIYTPEKQMKDIKKGSYSVESINQVKRWHYDQRSYSREVEMEADSLALILYSNAYKNPEYGILALQNLDSGLIQFPYLGSKVFEDLNFKDYSFKKEWAVVTQKGHVDLSNYISFDPDSSMTHPVLEKRIARLRELMSDQKNGPTNKKDEAYYKIKTDADFENIGCAKENGNVDQALYLALRLKRRFPHNAYVTQMIGDILLTIFDLKKDDISPQYDADTTGYNTEQMYVYNFVHNIKRSEIAELSYYFMNQKGNFNRENEAHYFLLFEICGMTNRMQMQALIRDKYKEKFQNGKFVLRMY